MTTTAVHSEQPTAAHEGLASELLARRRKKLPALTAALALAVAVAGGLIGGVEAQKHWGASSAATPGAGFAARFGGRPGGGAGGGGFAGAGGFPGAGGGATTGTVTLIKGSTLYVTDASGNTVLVHTTAGSAVQKTVSGTLKTVHPGDSVTVTGSQNNDGSYSAQKITIGGSNG
ncbi:MAG TPA: hypothetical protein VH210_08735 [Gaiellaceae bacterium]|jgi:hypothetical protein|nr:hypothetical protein [Gaiellaceae bacterium]